MILNENQKLSRRKKVLYNATSIRRVPIYILGCVLLKTGWLSPTVMTMIRVHRYISGRDVGLRRGDQQ